MSIFVKSKELEFDGFKVEVREIGVDFLLLSDEEKSDTKKLLAMHSSLTQDEVSKLTIEAFETILNEFYKLNDEHFKSEKSEDESVGK